MRALALAVAAVLAAPLVACGGKGDDPFVRDIRTFCNPPDPHLELPTDQRRVAVARDLVSIIKTPEAARLIARAMQVAPQDRMQVLGPALQKAGLDRCPFFDP